MSLRLNSLLEEYGIAPNPKFYRTKGKSIGSTNYPLPIYPKYLDFVKVMLGLHLVETEFAEDEANELTIETNYVNEFESIKETTQTLFSRLTNRTIKLNIVHAAARSGYNQRLWPNGDEKIVLFSGGLDSLCGALEIAKGSRPILTHVVTNDLIYNRVVALSNSVGLKETPLFCFDARSKSTMGGVSETRGLLFCSAAFAIAASLGSDSIVFCENGAQMLDVMLNSLLYPNKPATKNTNPIYLELVGELFSAFSGSSFRIEKIFNNKTRAEVVSDFINVIDLENTLSCFTVRGVEAMCGICYNCFVRRMSLEALDIHERDDTYLHDPFLKTNDILPPSRERILMCLLRCYFNVLNGDENTINDIELSSRDFFDEPVDLARRFGQELFLGSKIHLQNLKGKDLSALGKKTNELIGMLDKKLLLEGATSLGRMSGH